MAIFGWLRSEAAHASDAAIHIDVSVVVADDVGQPRRYAVRHHVRVLQPSDQVTYKAKTHVATGVQDARGPNSQFVQGPAQVLRPDVDDVLH